MWKFNDGLMNTLMLISFKSCFRQQLTQIKMQDYRLDEESVSAANDTFHFVG